MKRLATAAVAVAMLASIPAASAAGTLSGRYKAKVTRDHSLGGALNGTWVLDFTKGAYTVADNGKVVIHGNYSIKGRRITFHEKRGPDACPGTGKYRFRLRGAKLTFTRISDPGCVGRRDVLKHTFTHVR